MKSFFSLATVSVLSFSTCLLQAEKKTFADYLELSKQAQIVGDSHNADVYEQLALMKREADGEPDYNWSEFNKLKKTLKNRSHKPFNKKAVEFFKSTSDSDETRVCYVIDFSSSMKGKRIELLRHELTHSIAELPEDTQFNAFFFAGPVWQPGDLLKKIDGNKEHVTVTNNDVATEWKGKGASTWTSNQATAPAPWQLASQAAKAEIGEHIRQQELVWGTDWSSPLEAALNLEPLPDVIYFMTDGTCKSANQSAKAMAALAKEKGVRINSIAMMEPKAEKPMQYIAAETGGDFVVITPDGECKLHAAGCVEKPELDEDEHEAKAERKIGKKDNKVNKDKKGKKKQKKERNKAK